MGLKTWPSQITALLLLLLTASACSKGEEEAPAALTANDLAVSSWSMSSPQVGATANDPTPLLSGTSTFEGMIINVYLSSDCSGTALGSATVSSGVFAISPFTLPVDGTYQFYFTLEDTRLGIRSGCKDSALWYVLDKTPTSPLLATAPTLTNSTTLQFTLASCVDSSYYMVSATQPAADDSGWLLCQDNGTFDILLTEGSNTINVWGKSDEERIARTATSHSVTLDTVPPSLPTSWSMASPSSGTTSTDTTPDVAGAAPENDSVVSIYNGNTCSGSAISTGTVSSGLFSISSFTLSTDGDYSFFYKITDPAGNSTACSSTGLHYTLDTTGPASPTISINNDEPGTNFPDVTITLNWSETVSPPVEMCLSEAADCSACSDPNNWEEALSPKGKTMNDTSAGTKTYAVQFRDALGNVSACVTDLVQYAPPAVTPRYSAATSWNQYVKASAPTQACDGTETGVNACIHGGPARQVVTLRTSCEGMTLTDALGAFDWTCSVGSSGYAVFDAAFKRGKGLKDLIKEDGSDWKDNDVTLSFGDLSATSTSPAWWDNAVGLLPDNSATSVTNLSVAGKVYALVSDQATTGYNITADGVSVVTLGTAKLSWVPGSPSNCSSIDGKTADADLTCVIASGEQRFLWLEGTIDAGSTATEADFGVYLNSTSFSRLHLAHVSNAATAGIRLDSTSKSNTVSFARLMNNKAGIEVHNFSDYNFIDSITAANNATFGLYLQSSANNTILNTVAASNGNAGIFVKSAANNRIIASTVNLNKNYGVWLYASSSNILTHLVAANNVSGIQMTAASGNNTLGQLALASNDVGATLSNSSNNKFTGVLLMGGNTTACAVTTGVNPGLVNSTCTTTGTSGSSSYGDADASNATLVTGLSVASSFKGKLTTNDTANSSESVGTATYDTGLDWANFDNAFRAWGKNSSNSFPNTDQRDRCISGTCRVWDWRLAISNSTIRGKTGDGILPNDTIVAGACPSQVNGSVTSSDQQSRSTYLRNAVELPEFSTGNRNGLCESGDACLYLPNYGAYQGHGSLNRCSFVGGTVTGVTMYYFSVNGS